MSPGGPVGLAQWAWGCSVACLLPSHTQHRLGTAVGAAEPTTLLAGPGPSPEWSGGGIEHIPSDEGDLFYGLSLCIDGFYWPMGSSDFTMTLLRKSGPRGQDAAVSGGRRGLFAWQAGTGWECGVIVAWLPQAEQVPYPHNEGNQG